MPSTLDGQLRATGRWKNPASLLWTPLIHAFRTTWLWVNPMVRFVLFFTDKPSQIRIHGQHAGWPIAGGEQVKLIPLKLHIDRLPVWMWTQRPWFPRCAIVPLRGVSCRACCDHGRSIFSADIPFLCTRWRRTELSTMQLLLYYAAG